MQKGIVKMECEIDANRDITKIITRLRTCHFGSMKINIGGTRTYRKCRNCPEEELSPEHVIACPAILVALHNLGEYPFRGDLYSGKNVDLARVVLQTHGLI